jgi:hypothetical protein
MSKIKYPVQIDPDYVCRVVDADGVGIACTVGDFERACGGMAYAAQALADALNAGNYWQPIKSAPTDGTWILGVCSGVTVKMRRGCTNSAWVYQGGDPVPEFQNPTKWMPLPSPHKPDQPDDDDEAVALLQELVKMEFGAIQRARDYLAKREKGGGDDC